MSWLQYTMGSHKVNTDLICSVTLVSLMSSTVIVKLIYFHVLKGQHTLAIQQYFSKYHLPPH